MNTYNKLLQNQLLKQFAFYENNTANLKEPQQIQRVGWHIPSLVDIKILIEQYMFL